MENDKSALTGAQAQIERLRKLKEQKDSADKLKKDEEFRFAELPHAVVNPASIQVQAAADSRGKAEISENAGGAGISRARKTQRASRLDRRNFDRVRKTVKKIKEAGSSMRLSDDMFINMILEKALDLKIDFSGALTSEDVRAIINKIKAE